MIKFIYEFLRFIKTSYRLGFIQPIKSLMEGCDFPDKYISLSKTKKAILMQTPTHKNLGDHAIAYAERKFIQDNLDDYNMIEVPYKDVYRMAKKIRNSMNYGDIIFIHGGGNLGDMYVYEEYMRRFIIKYFKKYKIVSFPQTFDFSDTFTGKAELLKSKRVYRRHKNLFIVARESESYNRMKVIGNRKILLTPDIVLTLDKTVDSSRNGAVTCFRNDREKSLSLENCEKINEVLIKHFSTIIKTDTLLNKDVSIEEREFELQKMWSIIRRAEIVITDRLHGMIFCAITSTPCIVFKNSNHKIECTYKDWLSNCNFIYLYDGEMSTEKLEEKIKQLKDIVPEKINLKDKFKPLIDILQADKV